MRLFTTRILCLWTLVLPMFAHASLVHFTESDCPLLENPKTVLLVHASWCSHCRAFKPTYKKVSNLDKYKEWTFFEVEADNIYKVCGTWIDGYPYTYKNNMKNLLKGNKSERDLERFLDWD